MFRANCDGLHNGGRFLVVAMVDGGIQWVLGDLFF